MGKCIHKSRRTVLDKEKFVPVLDSNMHDCGLGEEIHQCQMSVDRKNYL